MSTDRINISAPIKWPAGFQPADSGPVIGWDVRALAPGGNDHAVAAHAQAKGYADPSSPLYAGGDFSDFLIPLAAQVFDTATLAEAIPGRGPSWADVRAVAAYAWAAARILGDHREGIVNQAVKSIWERQYQRGDHGAANGSDESPGGGPGLGGGRDQAGDQAGGIPDEKGDQCPG